MSNLAVGVSLLQSCETSLLAHHTHNLVTLIIQDNHSYREVEVLHIKNLLHKLLVQLITEAEFLDVCVLGLLQSLLVEESHTLAIAGEHIEELVLRQHKVIAYLFDNLKRQQVISAERDILVFPAADRYNLSLHIVTLVEDILAAARIFRGNSILYSKSANPNYTLRFSVRSLWLCNWSILSHSYKDYIYTSEPINSNMQISRILRIWWLTGDLKVCVPPLQ